MRDVQRMLERVPLGPILAAGFAIAVAFALFAMPAARMAQGVTATGLPALLPTTAPPIGWSARATLMLLGAAFGGGAVWALFDWLERPEARKRPVRSGLPALRRADAHPDAPARRPIFAAADLGAPLDQAPEPLWRDEAPKLIVVPLPGEELLLDCTLAEDEAALGLVAAGPPPPGSPEQLRLSSAELVARLERDLQRRNGRVPRATPSLLRDLLAINARVSAT